MKTLDQNDPYRPPAAAVGPAPYQAEGWRTSVLILVLLQLLFYAFNAASGLRAVQAGEISAVAFLASVSAAVCLLAGAVMLWLRSRAGIYLFAISALSAGVALLLAPTRTGVTGLGIAVIASLVCLRATAPRKAANPQ